MLKTRVIPTLLVKDVGLVKGIGFNSWRRVDTVLPAIKVYNLREVDELIVVDITASTQGRAPDFEAVAEFSEECFVPLTVGGGIKSLDDIKTLLRSGADKITINSAAYEDKHLISRAADRFGSQCIVVSIDANKDDKGNYMCYSHSGSRPTVRKVGEWAKEVEELGAGEILITSIKNDGTMQGYDLDLIKRVTESVSIPVIASGGAGNYQHMYEAITIANASAVAAASIYHFTQQTPKEAKIYMAGKGIPVRNSSIK